VTQGFITEGRQEPVIASMKRRENHVRITYVTVGIKINLQAITSELYWVSPAKHAACSIKIHNLNNVYSTSLLFLLNIYKLINIEMTV
jgi:hypothetical protein